MPSLIPEGTVEILVPAMDVHSPEQRSFNMSRVKGKDTAPELVVRKWLWANGFRYRLHRKDMPGKPDIVLPKYNAVIFVHGCYWHRHGCRKTTTPKTRREFWIAKFRENEERDSRSLKALLEVGWRVMLVWECSLRGKDSYPNLVFDQIAYFLNSDVRFLESGVTFPSVKWPCTTVPRMQS